MIGRGQLSVSAAVEIAQGISEDVDLPDGAIKAFASLGSNGDHPQNCERDLHRWLRNLYGFKLEPYKISVELNVGGKKKRTVSLPVLLPHEVLHMISASPFVFDSVWLGCLDDVSRYQFWGHIKTLSPWKNHPILQSDVDLARLIGVNIHGDGAVMKRDDECFVWSVSSCFASSGPIQDPLMMKFAVAIVHERFMLSKQVQKNVNAEIAKLIAWSLHYASLGTAPTQGYYGEPFPPNSYRSEMAGKELANGWKACYFACKADLKARKYMRNFRRYYLCAQLCDTCLASTRKGTPDAMHAGNYNADAAWRLTVLDHDTYVAMENPDTVSPFSLIEGFNVETVAYDFLHQIYLGTARDLIASGVRTLILRGAYDHLQSDDLDTILDVVQKEMHNDCASNGSYLPCKPVLCTASIGGLSDYAEMSSRYKASTIKLMVWWLAMKTSAIAEHSEDTVLQVLATCAWSLQRVVEIQDSGGMVLTQTDANDAGDLLRLHIKAFVWLALYFKPRKLWLFKIRPKTHYNFHMAERLKLWRVNHNILDTFQDESYLGKLKSIALKAHGGTMVLRVMQRYLLTLALYMHHYQSD
ncbi:unnamed protein product [Durusdinium trenchii]|uniref:Uncharacterized protein n=1 Tax=Durusdinium trenchii TaxID=1381693 RepID=A0ABP0P520_9DINO